MRAVKEKGGPSSPPFFYVNAAVIEGKLFSFSEFCCATQCLYCPELMEDWVARKPPAFGLNGVDDALGQASRPPVKRQTKACDDRIRKCDVSALGTF